MREGNENNLMTLAFDHIRNNDFSGLIGTLRSRVNDAMTSGMDADGVNDMLRPLFQRLNELLGKPVLDVANPLEWLRKSDHTLLQETFAKIRAKLARADKNELHDKTSKDVMSGLEHLHGVAYNHIAYEPYGRLFCQLMLVLCGILDRAQIEMGLEPWLTAALNPGQGQSGGVVPLKM